MSTEQKPTEIPTETPTETPVEPKPTLFEKISTAFGYPPETEAHKAGREAGEAVVETVENAKAAVTEAISPAAPEPEPKTFVEIVQEGLTETGEQIKAATRPVTPPPKPTSEVVAEKYEETKQQATEAYEGAKEAVEKAVAPKEKTTVEKIQDSVDQTAKDVNDSLNGK